MGETSVTWRPASEPPQVAEGGAVSVIVARRSDKGWWYTFGAAYANRYEVYDESQDDDLGHFTGFYTECERCERIDRVEAEFWAPMPAPPTP